MDEMNLLTSMRDEVPLTAPSPGAERHFRAGLTGSERSPRVRPVRPRHRVLPGAAGANGQLRWWKLAVPAVVAAGLAAALIALFLPPDAGPRAHPPAEGPSAGVPISAQLLADIAAKGVLSSRQRVGPEQWVYQKIESYSVPAGTPSRPQKAFHVLTQWVMADGADQQWGPANGHMIGGLVLTGPSAKADEKILARAVAAYEKLDSLPKDPAALEAYFADKATSCPTLMPAVRPAGSHEASSAATVTPCPNPPPAFRAEQAYMAIQGMLSSEILPPGLTAELYHALADVPGVIAKKDVKDISGQTGVEFILPQSPYNVNLGTILSATTYQYLGQAYWTGHPPYVWDRHGHASGSYGEDVLLDQALVSGPGVRP
jgi:hypothetical protein